MSALGWHQHIEVQMLPQHRQPVVNHDEAIAVTLLAQSTC
ncbi:unnamed protein product [Schistosoma mattheei]|uniref:Uncharacterized protein n=1 Tax=Schistosoma mattheei TaxID=31246 RepID=A0A183PTG1_9TREM|nr:unnamed protein product [Schistosoma mattheei]